MKDIPIFPTEYGVASLFLKEIPYRGIAYIRVQDVQPGCLKQLIEECGDFCRAAGAERIYATGHPELEDYTLHCVVERMTLGQDGPCAPTAQLWPVTEATVSQWREIYNDAMKNIDLAVTQTKLDENEICQSGGAYFVHAGEEMLGIGWVREDCLLAVAAAQPGQGRRVTQTLMSLIDGPQVWLEVASTNARAKGLYQKLGFVKTGETTRWYKVFEKMPLSGKNT